MKIAIMKIDDKKMLIKLMTKKWKKKYHYYGWSWMILS